MTKELEALERLRNTLLAEGYWQDVLQDVAIIETALKNQKRKLDLIGEVLVDISKGNYADLNDAINEIREVLEDD